MNRKPLLAGALSCVMLLVAACATAGPRTVTAPDAPRALSGDSPVQVSWTDPAQFTEIRSSSNRFEAQSGNWVYQLAEALRKSAVKRLPPGQTLEVRFTDIKRAGDFEPQHGPRANDIRIMRDVYPPRITLDFTLRDAGGRVLQEGKDVKLVGLNYLQNGVGLRSNSDPLRYEEQMLDDWLRKLLTATRR
ncbi:DUF3016 domain-containing protein [Stenotrophomonas sp. NPDC047960]|uniref:DUF3016 domain-containing protein n=1 Tax=Stenotrophomonas sp. NPDC047960 TaxID=3364531 RepID=UPI0037203715